MNFSNDEMNLMCNPKVNKLAQNGLVYLNQILKGEIPL